MRGERKQPGAEARPSAMFSGGNRADYTASPTWAQAIQRRRLQEEHGLIRDRAAVVAGLAYGEGVV